MIKVFIWLPGIENVGHSSALIGTNNEPYSQYISWWPSKNQKPTKPTLGTNPSYQDDLILEQKDPDLVIEIENLDEVKAAEWWANFLNQKNPKYSLTSSNCSWAVMKALKAGGSDKHIPWHSFYKKYNYNLKLPRFENTLYKYLKAAYKNYRTTKDLKFAFKRPIVDIVDDYSSIWSPTDVNSYCDIVVRSIKGEPDPFLKFNLLPRSIGF